MKVRVKLALYKNEEEDARHGTMIETKIVDKGREFWLMCVVVWDTGRISLVPSRDLVAIRTEKK